MFKVKKTGTEETLRQVKNQIKSRLESLPGKIEVIRSFEVGINVVMSERAFDIALVSSFDNLDDLETYRVHPAHQEVVEYIAGVKEKSAAVDFII